MWRLIIFVILLTYTNAFTYFPYYTFIHKPCDCVCGLSMDEIDNKNPLHGKIVGGEESEPNRYPWMVGLFKNKTFYCGGSIISKYHILTAAHCVHERKNDFEVYFGGHNISSDYIDKRRIRNIFEHESFDTDSLDSDIAILELDRPIAFGPRIQPICLPKSKSEDYSGKFAIIAGWGRLEEKGNYSSILHHAVVEIWSNDKCDKSDFVVRNITENMICAGYDDGDVDACEGDSGSPMHFEGETGSMVQIALVSWGRGCARPNYPGVYTRIDSFVNWIKQKLNGQCLCRPKIGNRTNFLENHLASDDEENLKKIL